LTDNIIPTIREYVSSARKFAPRIPLQWKNNSCESSFYCPGFFAQAPVFGMVSFLSVDVTDDDSVCFVRPNNKNFCSKVPFSFCDLFKYEASVGAYLTDNIIPTIREYVNSARKFAPRIPLQWKNNSCESINPILKFNQNWAPEKLPELINKIHKEIILQENRVKGALYGHGDFSRFFLHENVLVFFTRFYCPGFFAQAPVFGMVSFPSVDVTDDDSVCFVREYVNSARKFAPRIPLQWKNNSCESINPTKISEAICLVAFSFIPILFFKYLVKF
jgi:hypothetical protein